MNHALTSCPSEDELHAWVDERDETLASAERSAIDTHLGSCNVCTDQVEELRLFRTLLLRTRVPTLDDEQWRLLDQRVEMLAGEPPPTGGRVAGRIYWGVAIAAALSLFAIGAWQLMSDRGESPTSILSPNGQARVAGAFAAVEVAMAEGAMEFAGADGRFRRLAAGDKLERNGQIRNVGTEQGRLVVAGNFEMKLGQGAVVRVLADNEREFFVRLRHGEVRCQVGKRKPGQRFGVLAGQFRASVVGTEFTVRHDDQGRVAVEVSEGAVRVEEAADPWRDAGETTVVVRAGNRWRFTGGRMDLGPIVPAVAPAAQIPAAQIPAAQAPAAPVAEAVASDAPEGDTDQAPAAAPTARAARAARRAPLKGRVTEVSASKRKATAPTAVSPEEKPEARSAPAKPGRTVETGEPRLPPPLPPQAALPAPVQHADAPATSPAKAAKAAKPTPASNKPGAKARRPGEHRIYIDLPPQSMTPEEVLRAKAAEAAKAGHRANPGADAR